MYKVSNLLKHLKQKEVFFILPEINVAEARGYMKERQIGAVSVVSGLEFVGILTERDILWKCEPGDNLLLVTVESIMTPKEVVVSVNPNADLMECFSLMDVHRIRHLPVVEEDNLVGMVSIRDLVRAIVDQQIFVSDQLESYIRGGS